ncbi:MAG TPA: hypothetical protein DD979_02225 [Gammaproteobacteria bacterium]|nr:hypothetical protein [Gammaproteobacteria bacterium]
MMQKPRNTRVGAYALLTRGEQMLFCRISPQVPRWQGMWTLPGGGVEFAEHPSDTVVREVFEEIGLHVVHDQVDAITCCYEDTQDHEFHGIRILYQARILEGQLRAEVAGTTDLVAWLTVDQVCQLPLVDIARDGLALVYGDS